MTGKRTRALNKSQIKRARISGIVMLVLSAFVMAFFIPNAEGVATFGLSGSGETIQLDALAIPVTASLWALAMLLAALGATQFVRAGFQRKSTLILGISFGVFTMAMMVWATAGEQFSLISMLVSTVSRCTPIALGALSGILCERSGVVNIGIEGMLLGGAFTGVVMGSILGGWVGLLAATLTGGLLALLLAVLAVNFRVDQIIIGVVINILVLGLTSFLTSQVLVDNPQWNDAPIFPSIPIPVLSDIPIIGPMFFNQTIIVYGMYVLIGTVTFFLFRTRWGLRTRSVGENPRAADSLGVSVPRVQVPGRDLRRHGRRLRRCLVHVGHRGPLRREHHGRHRLHRTGGDDLRRLEPDRCTRGGADLRLLRVAGAEVRAPRHPHPGRVPVDGALPRHDRRGRRPRRTRPPAGRGRPALREAVMADIDWAVLDAAAVEIMHKAYAPYSKFKVGVAGLMEDGRIVVGCNVENACYGIGLCAECGMVSSIHATGGGRLAAVSCVDQHGQSLMPCGRCRQLLWENGRPTTLLKTPEGILPMSEILPQAFGPDDLVERAEDRTFHG